MNLYRHAFTAVCPVNGDTIAYVLWIAHEATIPAEDIEAACTNLTALHEDIADRLAATLPGHQTITAWHGKTRIRTVRRALPRHESL